MVADGVEIAPMALDSMIANQAMGAAQIEQPIDGTLEQHLQHHHISPLAHGIDAGDFLAELHQAGPARRAEVLLT